MENNAVKGAFEQVTKKHELSALKLQEVSDQLIQEIEKALSKLQSISDPSSEHRIILNELKTKLKEIVPLKQMEGPQKELNVALSKFQKLLEKSFNMDIAKAYRNVDQDTHTLNQIIASHFYREGLFEVGDCFIKEANEENADVMRAPFVEMYSIIEAIKSRNLDPALSWCDANHEKLIKNGSSLELSLRASQFVEIVKNRERREDALKYARVFLGPFASTHRTQVQKLTASLVWAGKLENSPYSYLLSDKNWKDLPELFTLEYCKILGQSYVSPLSVTISAGFQGLPTLLKMMNVMVKSKHEWQNMKQLPVPMDLDKEFQFHSVFVCPVSREQATDENPPMLMTCGHVLCKQSITKLSKNNSTRPFKCPYCPSEVEVGKCRQLYV